MATNSTAAGIASLLNGLSGLVTPFAQTFGLGKGTASEGALQAERNGFNALNGSGANAPGLSRQSPRGLLDLLFGTPLDRKSTTPASATTAAVASPLATLLLPAALLVGLAIAVIYVLRRL